MANYATLKAAIQAVIKQNGNNEITGDLLQQALMSMINSLGDGYQFIDVATPTTNPGTPDQKVFYIAYQPGVYANFGGVTVPRDINILKYDTEWSLISLTGGEMDLGSQMLFDSKTFTGLVNSISILSTDIERGGYQYSNKVAATNRLRVKHPILISKNTTIDIDPNGLKMNFFVLSSLGETDYLWQSGWKTAQETLTPGVSGFLFFVVSNTDETGIYVSDYNGTVTINNPDFANIQAQIDAQTEALNYLMQNKILSNFVIGGWAAGGYLDRTDRARIERVNVLNQLYVFGYNYLKFRAAAFYYTYDSATQTYTYQSFDQQQADDYTKSGRIFTLPSSLAGRTDVYVGVAIIKRDGTDITAQELNDIKNSVVIDYNLPKIISGPNRLAYQFGGDGNDWCFVRTPADYDAKRKKPYPFVICNHGNGWTMNGNGNTMNWTKRTMYVPTTDPDYIANPTQYNGTEDKTLWYSNPTIEALLAAGYVVCGCENYADSLYGNEDCRKACAQFFEHIQEYYNVEKRCCMIGASNGAQTSINAAYLLGEKVKAMILQYPLSCLVNQYFAHPEHQAGIRAAYGITDPNITEADLIKATRTHDVLHTDVVAQTKVSYFPPTRLYYSEADSVVPYSANSIALFDLLDASLKIVEKVQVTGSHGDASNFVPSAYVNFFDEY